MYMSFDLHSDTRANNKKEFNFLCKSKMDILHKGLKESKWLFITLGTAWSYTYLNTNRMVANCHKLPPKII